MSRKTEDQSGDLISYRKKRKRKLFIRRMITLTVVFGISLLAYLALSQNLLDGIGGILDYASLTLAKGETVGFPIRLSGEQIEETDLMGKLLVLLTRQNAYLYDENSKKIRQITHGYTNPWLKTGSNRLLIYDRGGTKFTVESAVKNIYTQKLEQKIIFGALGSQGYAAVVTQDERYMNQLVIYDKAGKEIYRWYSAQKLIVALDFAKNSRGCVVSTVGMEEGRLKSSLYGLDFNSSKETFCRDIDDSIVVSVACKTNGNYAIICNDSAFVLSPDGKISGQKTFDKDITFFEDKMKDDTLLALGDFVNSSGELCLLNLRKNEQLAAAVEDGIIDIAANSNQIAVLTDKRILLYDFSLKPVRSFESAHGSRKLVFAEKYLFVISSSGVSRLDANP